MFAHKRSRANIHKKSVRRIFLILLRSRAPPLSLGARPKLNLHEINYDTRLRERERVKLFALSSADSLVFRLGARREIMQAQICDKFYAEMSLH